MVSRVVFFCIALFWVTMNVLLWRSEYASRNTAGSAVPVEMVWQKILSAPDNSSLDLYHHKKRIGFCRWAAVVTEEVLPRAPEEGPEGMVRRATGYRIDVDGNVEIPDLSPRLRFNLSFKFATNHIWQELTLHLNARPLAWAVRANAAERAVRVEIEDENGMAERVFKFSDLQNPQALLKQIDSPVPVPLMTSALSLRPKGSALELGLKWEARNDWFKIAHASVRAYSVQAKLLDRYSIKVVVSKVGEILRVELPDEVVFINDQLAPF